MKVSREREAESVRTNPELEVLSVVLPGRGDDNLSGVTVASRGGELRTDVMDFDDGPRATDGDSCRVDEGRDVGVADLERKAPVSILTRFVAGSSSSEFEWTNGEVNSRETDTKRL